MDVFAGASGAVALQAVKVEILASSSSGSSSLLIVIGVFLGKYFLRKIQSANVREDTKLVNMRETTVPKESGKAVKYGEIIPAGY